MKSSQSPILRIVPLCLNVKISLSGGEQDFRKEFWNAEPRESGVRKGTHKLERVLRQVILPQFIFSMGMGKAFRGFFLPHLFLLFLLSLCFLKFTSELFDFSGEGRT